MAGAYIELIDDAAEVHPDDLALITRHLAVTSGAVLDAGCGPGHLTRHLGSLGVDALGLDLVPAFVDHARAADPNGSYTLGSLDRLPFDDGAFAGILAWYSLIHLPPERFDAVLVELRRVLAPDAPLVVGFFDGTDVEPFDHKVVTAYRRPVDDLARRLSRSGFDEVDREQRPGLDEAGRRPHAALVATAT